MIQEYKKDGKVLYKVRVYVRSKESPDLRVTRQEGGFTTAIEAKKHEATLRKECERELHQSEARGVLWGDLLSEWHEHSLQTKVATGVRSKLNQDDYFGSMRKWLGRFSNRPASDLNAFVMAEVFESMKEKGLCFGHRKKLKQIIKSVFDFGIQSGRLKNLQRSPTFDIVLGKDSESRPEILTIGEIQTLIEKAFDSDHRWKRVWATALLTGMRSGELFALEWSDVDFANRLINVNKSHNCRLKTIKSTKAGYWRQVPISEDLEKVLREQRNETIAGEHVFPRIADWQRGLQAKVMKICGWKELKTMQHYVRLAGIDVQGATEAIKLFDTAPAFNSTNLLKLASFDRMG